MKKQFAFLLLSLAIFLQAYGQDQEEIIDSGINKLDMAPSEETADTVKAWTIKGDVSLNFSQASFTNWAAGGENAISGVSGFNLSTIYNKGKHFFNNRLQLGFGLARQGENPFRKTDDIIDYGNTYAYKLSKVWAYGAGINFRTQFAPGYILPNDSVLKSNFFAPAYLGVMTGFKLQPGKVFTLYLAPVGVRFTFVKDQNLADDGEYGVTPAVRDDNDVIIIPGKNLRTEFVSFISLNINATIAKNVSLESRLQLYSNYLENPQNIDVMWDLLINMKINDFLSANLTTQLIYDDDINIPDEEGDLAPRLQFKEVLSIGLAYRFGPKD